MGGESMKAKLAFISAHVSTYSIRLLCSVLGVARSWFHDWQAGAQTRTVENLAEADLVGRHCHVNFRQRLLFEYLILSQHIHEIM